MRPQVRCARSIVSPLAAAATLFLKLPVPLSLQFETCRTAAFEALGFKKDIKSAQAHSVFGLVSKRTMTSLPWAGQRVNVAMPGYGH